MKLVHRMAVAIAWACFVIGAGLLACGLGSYHHSRTFLATCSRADGTVVKNILSSSSDNGPMYYPVFSFQTPDGETHTLAASESSSPPAYSVGQHVQVLYMPGDPDAAKLNSFTELWLVTTLFAVFWGGAWLGWIFWWLIDRLYVVPRMPAKAS